MSERVRPDLELMSLSHAGLFWGEEEAFFMGNVCGSPDMDGGGGLPRIR